MLVRGQRSKFCRRRRHRDNLNPRHGGTDPRRWRRRRRRQDTTSTAATFTMAVDTNTNTIPPEITKDLCQLLSSLTLGRDDDSANTGSNGDSDDFALEETLRAARERIAQAPELYDVALTGLVASMLEEVRVHSSYCSNKYCPPADARSPAQLTRTLNLTLLRRLLFRPAHHPTEPPHFPPLLSSACAPQALSNNINVSKSQSQSTQNPALGSLPDVSLVKTNIVVETRSTTKSTTSTPSFSPSSQHDDPDPGQVLTEAILNAVHASGNPFREAAFTLLESRPHLLAHIPEHIVRSGLEDDSNPNAS